MQISNKNMQTWPILEHQPTLTHHHTLSQDNTQSKQHPKERKRVVLGRKPQGGQSWQQAGACSLAIAPFIGPMPSVSGTSIILVPHWH
jgi:hypothetical protein